MELYGTTASPFFRTCATLVHEAGGTDLVTFTAASGTAVEPGTIPVALNPAGKIPVLVREDGPALYDSRVICRYFDAIWEMDLYPEGRLWETLTLEAHAHEMMVAAQMMTTEPRVRPPEMVFEPWVEGQWAKISRALDALEARWMSHLSGPRLDVAKFAVAVALGYLDLRHAARDWRDGRMALAAWEARFAQRPALLATRPG